VVQTQSASRQIRCRCGHRGAVVERTRVTIYRGEEEPWVISAHEDDGQVVEIRCEGCGWVARLLHGETGYRVRQQAQAEAPQPIFADSDF
jgi:DNA-directed RNA polymerase subunit RPC12/RpoP